MPSQYAHYRFGAERLAEMDKADEKLVRRFRELYDVGLSGPDIFFYYDPVFHSRVEALGNKFHAQTGQEFFTRACRILKKEPTEAGRAYLYGVLGHYCLDSVCHPFVREQTEKVGHTELETEFDRFLLETDGRRPPHTQNTGEHLRLTRGACETVAKFYPPATAGQVRASIQRMALCLRLLAAPEGPGRNLVRTVAPKLGRTPGEMVMPDRANPRCAPLDEPMLDRYRLAASRYPGMLVQLKNNLEKDTPLGPEFDSVFG